MRILILGCSHTAGAWGKKNYLNEYIPDSSIFKKVLQSKFKCHYDSGWSVHLANEYNQHTFYTFSHIGGGILNYIATISNLFKLYGQNYFDKVIVQHTDELRFTSYNYIEGSSFIENFPESIDTQTKTKYNNIKIFDYSQINKRLRNKLVPTSNVIVPFLNTEYMYKYIFKDFVNEELFGTFKKKYDSLSYKSVYLKFIADGFMYILKHLHDSIYSFNWNQVEDRINNQEKNLYNQLISRGDGRHLDIEGCELMYQLFKNDLREFIEK